MDTAIFIDVVRDVVHDQRNRRLQWHDQLLFCAQPFASSIFTPASVSLKQRPGQIQGLLNPHAAMGKSAPGEPEFTLRRGVVHEDGVGVGKDELHLTQGVLWSG